MTTAAVTPGPGPQVTRSQRWLARLSFLLAGLAIVILVVSAGLKSLAMLAVGLVGAVVSVASAYFFLARRGLWRWSAPVTCTVSPGALRVWVPRDRPGIPAPKPQVNWADLRDLVGISRSPH